MSPSVSLAEKGLVVTAAATPRLFRSTSVEGNAIPLPGQAGLLPLAVQRVSVRKGDSCCLT